MKKEDVDRFEKIQTQLEGLQAEIGILAKKSPNDGVNKFKLKFINELISDANDLLGEKYKPFSSFNQFDIDEVPSNSDITFILLQYLNCLEKLRADNIFRVREYDGNKYFFEWFWKIEGQKKKESNKIKTAPPKKIK